MTRRIPVLAVLALGALALLGAAAPARDALDRLLACGGLSRADLGLHPRGDWIGASRGLPGRLPFVDTLRAEPLRAPLFADGLAAAAAKYATRMDRFFLTLAIEPRFTSFGTFGANLPEADDLAAVLAHLRRPLDDPWLSTGAFGKVTALGGPAGKRDRADAERLPAALRPAVATLLAALDDADGWVRLAWRRVPPSAARTSVSRTELLAAIPDGSVYFPDVEDANRDLDHESLAYAGLKVIVAADRTNHELADLVRRAPAGAHEGLSWEVETPRGRISIRGTGRDRKPGDGRYLLAVDLGGDDVWLGEAGAARWPEQPVSLALDLGGADTYDARGRPSQGSGRGGVGVLLDREGNDSYRGGHGAQGFGQLGVGALVDGGGNDEYLLSDGGQGAAVYGIGLLLDRSGDDAYVLLHDGQGLGGPGGVGLLVDVSGNDRYRAEPDVPLAGRADPRAEMKAATSNAQGVGLGRRGDGSDGHAWPGGLGALLDLGGNDLYVGGTWCQGAGYWWGTGVLVDAGGDDVYESVWYAQGSAAHHALGVLLDRAGDDRHSLLGSGGAGLGFGWDLATGVFVDLLGSDTYEANRMALGSAAQRSIALFLDAAGDDRYLVTDTSQAFGFVDDDNRWAERRGFAPAGFEAPQIGLFLDLDGSDFYPSGAAQPGAMWGSWDRRLEAPRNLGAGIDGTRLHLPQELEPLLR